MYRFIIAITIGVFHYLKIWSNNNNGRLGVEFFFILSGFLLICHCDRKRDESTGKIIIGKIATFYPYYVVLFGIAVIFYSMISKTNIIKNCYTYIHQLMFLTDWFERGAKYLPGTGQLWFVTTQLWMTLVLSYLIKNHRKAYENIIAPLFVIVGYSFIIHCKGNLNADYYTTIGRNDIWLPLKFIRALAGLSCGTLMYVAYIKLREYRYTPLAQRIGRFLSISSLLLAIWLSYRPKNVKVNSYNWRTMIVVCLYAFAILCAFLFGNNFCFKKDFLNKVIKFLGKLSLIIYLVHPVVIFIMQKTLDVSENCLMYVCIFSVGTLVMCGICEISVKLLRNTWRYLLPRIKLICIEGMN